MGIRRDATVEEVILYPRRRRYRSDRLNDIERVLWVLLKKNIEIQGMILIRGGETMASNLSSRHRKHG